MGLWQLPEGLTGTNRIRIVVSVCVLSLIVGMIFFGNSTISPLDHGRTDGGRKNRSQMIPATKDTTAIKISRSVSDMAVNG